MSKNDDILAYIAGHLGITLGQLHQVMGGDYLKLSSRLQTLRREKLIEARKGKSYKGWWAIGQDGATTEAREESPMEQITITCAHCGATNNTFVQPDVDWMSAVRRMEREHAAMLEACKLAEAELERERQARQERADEETDEMRRGVYQVPPTPALSALRAAIDAAEQE